MTTYLLPTIKNNPRLLIVLKIPRHPLPQMDRDPQLVPGVVEDDRVQLAPVAVEDGRVGVHLRGRLRDDQLPGVLVDPEAVVAEVDAEGPHAVGDDAVGPAAEDATGVGAEGDDVAELFEFCGYR